MTYAEKCAKKAWKHLLMTLTKRTITGEGVDQDIMVAIHLLALGLAKCRLLDVPEDVLKELEATTTGDLKAAGIEIPEMGD